MVELKLATVGKKGCWWDFVVVVASEIERCVFGVVAGSDADSDAD